MTHPTTAARGAPGRAAAPLGVAAATGAALAFVAAVDPEQPGHYPVCPFYAVTDLYCPACGSLRAMHAVTHGDLGTALDRNVLTVAAIPVLALFWFAWLRRSLTGRSPVWAVPASWLWTLAVGVLVFTVLRNTDVGAWLAP